MLERAGLDVQQGKIYYFHVQSKSFITISLIMTNQLLRQIGYLEVTN